MKVLVWILRIVVFIALFAVEQLVNGWRRGFAGPEDDDIVVPIVT